MKKYSKSNISKKKVKIYTIIFLNIIVISIILLIILLEKQNPEIKLAFDNALQKGKAVYTYTEPSGKWNRGELVRLPDKVDYGNCFSIDLRSYDISKFDLIHYRELDYAAFDTNTIWPEKLPTDFLPEKIMEIGKNPGLGIKQLHERGITGKGINIAIVDSALFVEHEEYKENIMLYELLHNLDENAGMHGSAVVSIAVGRNTGVAPEAKVYYIASTFGEYTQEGPVVNLTFMADSIYRVLEINKDLPTADKIKVISISRGFTADEKGYAEVAKAIEDAKAEEIFVLTCTPKENYGFYLWGLGRDLNDNPDNINSYSPGLLQAEFYYNNVEKNCNVIDINNTLMVPMDSRTYAFCTGNSDYAFNRQGGLSFAAPWLAGMYALCLQVDATITPEKFIRLAFENGSVIKIPYGNREYDFGTIIHPAGMIDALIEKSKAPIP